MDIEDIFGEIEKQPKTKDINKKINKEQNIINEVKQFMKAN